MTFGSRTAAISVALVLLSVRLAYATTNQAVSVTGNVVGDCTTVPSTGTLAFGNYNPLSTSDLSAATPFTFSINCTRGDTNLTAAVDGGTNYANAVPSGNRAMKDNTGHYLSYQLYEDSGDRTAWPFSSSGGSGTPVALTAGGISTANTISLYGVIPHGQTAATDVGSYSDTVRVTVNY
ncbi:MAG TPA: spore coat protein U domain-containing protein [Candidatus Baltobacteraceae bacterium]|nr:spore coat protein U domain-containing protein [Candidatus Baltobacteraceae bacterium]